MHTLSVFITFITAFILLGCAAASPQEHPVEKPEATISSPQINETKSELIRELRIQEVYWKLIGVEGKAVIQAPNQREAYLILKLEAHRLQGFGGCNILLGSYELNEATQRIKFSHVASTMMACPRLPDESAFLKALARVEQFTIDEGVLLLQKEGKTVATFEASLEP